MTKQISFYRVNENFWKITGEHGKDFFTIKGEPGAWLLWDVRADRIADPTEFSGILSAFYFALGQLV